MSSLQIAIIINAGRYSKNNGFLQITFGKVRHKSAVKKVSFQISQDYSVPEKALILG